MIHILQTEYKWQAEMLWKTPTPQLNMKKPLSSTLITLKCFRVLDLHFFSISEAGTGKGVYACHVKWVETSWILPTNQIYHTNRSSDGMIKDGKLRPPTYRHLQWKLFLTSFSKLYPFLFFSNFHKLLLSLLNRDECWKASTYYINSTACVFFLES